MQETIRKFKEILAKLNAYQHALGVMQYDSETAMPRAGAAGTSWSFRFQAPPSSWPRRRSASSPRASPRPSPSRARRGAS